MSVTLDYAIVGTIVRLLKANGSWCGKLTSKRLLLLQRRFLVYRSQRRSFCINTDRFRLT